MANQATVDRPTDPMPHFVLVPLMAQGHMIPMIDIAHLLASRGATVSFITTPVNAARIKPVIDRIKKSTLPIHFVELPFPCAEVGLPDGCENVDLIPPGHPFKSFFDATTLLDHSLELHLQQHHHPGPTCIISDYCHPWTMRIARKLQIPRLVFHGTACFYLLCTRNIRLHGLYDRITNVFDPFLVPEIPHRVEVSIAQAPAFFFAPGWEDVRDEALEAEATAEGVVLNSFDELEPWFVDSYKKSLGKNVWAIGPLSLCNKDADSKSTRGNRAAVDEQIVSTWLDSMEPKSVIYVCFGTLSHTGLSQLVEIGLGLEASKRPFIWVVKEAEKSPEVQRWLSEGFEERTRGMGLVIKGWAPQVMILSHPAVGGVLTHCGWNSTLEAVSAGVPMVTWPHFTDQFLNEKLIVDVLRVGVAVGVKEPVARARENDEVPVKREDVEKAVVRLMNEGEEGEARRERARELGEKANKATEEGGSSYQNLTLLIQYFSEFENNSAEGKEEL